VPFTAKPASNVWFWKAIIRLSIACREVSNGDDRDIQIVFASKLPVNLAGKRRVGVEVQILFEIDRHAIGRTLKRPPQVRVKPESADP
jgi:hypothetical protein